MKLRSWQKHAKTIIERVVSSNDDNIIVVNACVGSGKTLVAEDAFGQFIKNNENDKTIQIFVTPRIRLCDQQTTSIANALNDMYSLQLNKDYNIVRVDCEKNEFDWRNTKHKIHGKHIVIVICSESLFGFDKLLNDTSVQRYSQWIKNFNAWKDAGYKLGFAVFDEAHNYENCHNYIVDDEESADKFFKVMVLSGTPSAFQKELTTRYKKNVCNCPPKTAIDNKWIVEPTLNIVKGDASQWARAIVAVLNREKKICEKEVFSPRIMINCSGIDEIKALNELQYFKENTGKKFHLISLHSVKRYINDDNEIGEVKPMIDCVEVDAATAYNKIEQIDSGTAFDDNLPILVAQVQMLGEGINVSSFNACLTASNSEKTAMQQIGRIVRNYTFNGKNKVEDGHANVYVMLDNSNTLYNLLKNLEEYELTDECFRWGDKIDISNSSNLEITNEEFSSLNKIEWQEIDPNEDLDIISVNSKMNKSVPKDIIKKFFSGCDCNDDGVPDIDEFKVIIKNLFNNDSLKKYTKRKFNSIEEIEKPKTKVKKNAVANDKANKQSNVNKKISNNTNDSYAEILLNIINKIHDMLQNNYWFKKAWNISSKKALLAILNHNEILAEFMDSHLTAEDKARLAK